MINLTKLFIGREEIKAAKKILKAGTLAQGPVVNELEKEFSRITGAKYAIAVSSGTSALHTALFSIGIKPGDEVITTPFTFVATANAILMQGARPVFVDIDEKTFNINPVAIKKAIAKKTKAIIAVNLYGQPADYSEIKKAIKGHKIFIVEDAAQSIGALYKGKKSGNLADISCFSLYATKNIMCGEGGMITTNNKRFAERATVFRHHGQDRKYNYAFLGYNYRMTDLQAAIALEQIKRLDFVTKSRRRNAELYDEGLKDIEGIITPYIKGNRTHVYHQYTIRITKDFKKSRDDVRKYLLEKGVISNIYYPKPLFYFKHLAFAKKGRYPASELVAQEVLSIPVHPLLKKSEIDYVIKQIKNI